VAEIPESLLRRSAEARAKALGVPVEDVLAEMKGEGPPVQVPQTEKSETAVAEATESETVVADVPENEVEEVPAEDEADAPTPEVETDGDQDVLPEEPKEATYADDPDPDPVPEPLPGEVHNEDDSAGEGVGDVAADDAAEAVEAESGAAEETAEEASEVATSEPAVAVAVAERPTEEPKPDANGSGNGSGNGKVAALVSPRPTVPPAGTPDGVRTQRLLTVVKARAIQNVKAEPTDKVNTWPHLMLMEFGALLAITGLLIIMSIVIHSPLLDPANFNATPNPSKAPWYFLGLQELLSYFDPQIAGVMVPTVTGLLFFLAIPFLDKNPSTTPSDRKFAIALYSVFLAGAATLTIIGVLFRGQGFNFTYPWQDGIFFDDLKDWVNFE
jgi:menaquinol-cytochrome c reductase cytochrome b/c subunit